MAVYGASRLAGCHADLVRLVTSVGASRNVQVVQGARSLEQEKQAIATGHSQLKDPTHSLHVVLPDLRPLALAVDLAPWPVDWTDIAGFRTLHDDVMRAAAALEIGIRWGGLWNDFDHYELAANGMCSA